MTFFTGMTGGFALGVILTALAASRAIAYHSARFERLKDSAKEATRTNLQEVSDKLSNLSGAVTAAGSELERLRAAADTMHAEETGKKGEPDYVIRQGMVMFPGKPLPAGRRILSVEEKKMLIPARNKIQISSPLHMLLYSGDWCSGDGKGYRVTPGTLNRTFSVPEGFNVEEYISSLDV